MTLWLPPYWLRRLVIGPVVLLAAVGLVVYVPLILLAAALLSYRLPGSWRALRLAGFGIVYLLMELVGLTVALGLWVGSGFGWKLRSPSFVTAHYALLRWCLRVLYAAGRRLFVLRVETDGPRLGDDGNPTKPERPLIIMSRHAGPGDSFLLLHEVLSWAGRRPRIVLKDTLQLDPFIDVVLNRLPSRFVHTGGTGRDDVTAAIAELSATMGPLDAFLIFPEGGNFTEGRRERAIASLREQGRLELAERAESMQHVLPPKPGGVLAAIAANPQADVVLVAHSGLDELNSLRDVWTAIPQHKVLHLAWVVEPHDRVPVGRSAQVEWLYDAWSGVDEWIAVRRETDASERPPTAG